MKAVLIIHFVISCLLCSPEPQIISSEVDSMDTCYLVARRMLEKDRQVTEADCYPFDKSAKLFRPDGDWIDDQGHKVNR